MLPCGYNVLGVDAPFHGERRAAEIADREPLDLEAAAVELHVDVGALGLDAAERGKSDLDRQRAFARPFEGGVAEHALRQRQHAVEIDFRRGESGLDSRRTVAAGPGIGQTSLQRHAVDFRLQPLDGDHVAAEADFALGAERTGRGRRLDPIGQPGDKSARVAGVDLGGSGKGDALRRDAEAAAEPDLGRAGSAEVQALDVPIRHRSSRRRSSRRR